VPYVHRVSSDRYFPFFVCVMSDDPPGEVIYAHPDADEDFVLPDGIEWKLVDRVPPGAVLGHVTTPASVVRSKPAVVKVGDGIPAGERRAG
jgi:hypothetical protein